VLFRSVVLARAAGRAAAEQLGFDVAATVAITTAVSEIARNIVQYARSGTISIRAVAEPDRTGIIIVARDRGPGIPDVTLAMQDGFSTSGGVGLALPGARRLMHEVEIHSRAGRGTVAAMKKWLVPPSAARPETAVP